MGNEQSALDPSTVAHTLATGRKVLVQHAETIDRLRRELARSRQYGQVMEQTVEEEYGKRAALKAELEQGRARIARLSQAQADAQAEAQQLRAQIAQGLKGVEQSHAQVVAELERATRRMSQCTTEKKLQALQLESCQTRLTKQCNNDGCRELRTKYEALQREVAAAHRDLVVLYDNIKRQARRPAPTLPDDSDSGDSDSGGSDAADSDADTGFFSDAIDSDADSILSAASDAETVVPWDAEQAETAAGAVGIGSGAGGPAGAGWREASVVRGGWW